jgi:uncharacterized spore protein YtfJ
MQEGGERKLPDLENLGEQLENLISSKTVIGEPIAVGEVTLVPIIKADFGFGLGGGNSEGVKRGGVSGGGGGAKIIPLAVIVVKGGEVSILSIDKQGSGNIGPLLEKLPQLFEKMPFFKKNKPETECEEAEDEA